jgi:hypothetical protein
MSEQRVWHVTIGGDPVAAVNYGLTLKAKCGAVWVPTLYSDRPHFVYRHFNRAGRVIYIGCTVAPRTRLEAHQAKAWWWPQVAKTTHVVFPNREYGFYMEAKAIAEENPRWNIRHRDRSAMTLDDFRDLRVAMTKNGVKPKALQRINREAIEKFGVAL